MPFDDHETAIAAAEAGAAVVRSRYGTELGRVEKTAGDFATEADIAAERAILAVLRTQRPDDAVTGEESGSSGPAGATRRWLVDPLCGTLNYAVRNPLVAVNVALRLPSGAIGAAAATDPFSGETFWTDGHTAWVRHDGADHPLHPSATSDLVDVNLDPPFPSHPALLLSEPGFTGRFRPRVLSTTLALLWVAAGRRAAYVTYGPVLDSVHFSAGIAICQAAGCTVTGIKGQPLHTGEGGLLAAADTPTHTELRTLITSAWSPTP
ncbi:myo-inositol-1(or 4)-monophosphatase [Actinoplanes lutulentus]|uniref:Myo-inositol-1(Or 4)-monophosphatase n=1 Tax=Actinoplanes lutulentus TaxID=1287878 RepID=A0A327Z0P4_9ACTN|nr:inositol monophosphatase family protein [Actinoplanes lutulentus]MBB2948661.1 myo-inositol-1(or 4)-monophosphatase [Actinoplanes lutulentus]RAK27968.1 myo-inositol-1(or 4)-monophosphatase [Actinoplanes lutulentus]